MNLTVNGKPRNIMAADGAGIPLHDFLREHEINPRLVAVAINGDVIPRDQYAGTVIHEGDAVEIVRMVGGGAR
jgi:thiamine biosynthesis protein ThiS